MLNKTSSPDININLSLPLVVEEQCCKEGAVYSCVAANPLNSQTVLLSAEDSIFIMQVRFV